MSRKSVDGLTRRELAERIFEYASEDEIAKAAGHAIQWGAGFRQNLDGFPGVETESPANALWLFSHGMTTAECARLVPDSWDVSPEEWRLSRV